MQEWFRRLIHLRTWRDMQVALAPFLTLPSAHSNLVRNKLTHTLMATKATAPQDVESTKDRERELKSTIKELWAQLMLLQGKGNDKGELEFESDTEGHHSDDQSFSQSMRGEDQREKGVEEKKTRGLRGPYKRHTPEEWEDFFNLVINHRYSVAAAATKLGIARQTAQHRYNQYLEDPDQGIPIDEPQGDDDDGDGDGDVGIDHKPRLQKKHTDFIINYLDSNPKVVVQELTEELCKAFQGLKVSKSAVQRHVAKECRYSLQRLPTQHEPDEDLKKVHRLREAWAKAWVGRESEFSQQSVFISEATFYLRTRRLRGWTKAVIDDDYDTETMQNSHKRGSSLTFLGAINAQGFIDVSLRLPKASTAITKGPRKGSPNGDDKPINTNAQLFLDFIDGVMDALDRSNLKNHNLVVGNASIHHAGDLAKRIKSRGHKATFVPPDSPFLNPIEEFWTKVAAMYRPQELQDGESVDMRLKEAAQWVSAEDIQGWIKHALSFLPQYLR